MRLPGPTDLALAAALAGMGLLEVGLTNVDADRLDLTLLLALCAGMAMLVRSSAPLLCLTTMVVLVLLAHVSTWGLNLTAALVVGCLLALGSVGKLCEDGRSFAAYTSTVVIFIVGAAFGSRPWDVVVALVGCSAGWGAGRVLRREAERNLELRSLTADLVEQREARAREAVAAERSRLARELHDTIAHTVSVMTLHVGGVRRRLEGEPSRALECDVLLDVESLGREAVAELHRLLSVLRSSDDGAEVDGDSSPQPRLSELPQLAARVRSAGAAVELRIDERLPSMPQGLELTAYRVIQEALTNVLKHGDGATATVTVSSSDGNLEVAVSDDGPASAAPEEPTDPDRTPLGLVGIRERVALYGGQVRVGPRPGAGFEVRVSLPIPEQELA